MKRTLAAVLIFINLALTTQPVLSRPVIENGSENPAKPVSADDCIQKFTNSERSFQIQTKNGLEVKIYRDALRRAELFEINGKAYQLKYDENIPSKLVSFKSVASGTETSVTDAVSEAYSPDGKIKLEEFAARIKPCPSQKNSPHKAIGGEVTAMGEGHHVEDPEAFDSGEPWDAYGFMREYTQESYWIAEQTSFFSAWMDNAFNTRDQQITCVRRYETCNIDCDNASDARSMACGVAVLLYSEIPIGAGLYGLACMGASLYHKNRCKSTCGSMADCM